MEEASVRVPLYLDLCPPISRHLCFFFWRQCLYNEGPRWEQGLQTCGSWHSQRSALHPSTVLYTYPSVWASCPVLFNPSASADNGFSPLFFRICPFFSNTQADIFCFKQDHIEIPLRESFYFLPKRGQTKTLLVVFNRRAREEFLLQQLSHYSLIFYDKLDLKFFHQTERLVDVKKHLVALWSTAAAHPPNINVTPERFFFFPSSHTQEIRDVKSDNGGTQNDIGQERVFFRRSDSSTQVQ